jgi:hypothetical protein
MNPITDPNYDRLYKVLIDVIPIFACSRNAPMREQDG